MNTKVKLLITVMLLWSCGSSTEKTEDSQEDVREEQPEKRAAEDSNLLAGHASLQIGDETSEINQFMKNKTEITLLDDKFTVRLSSSGDDKFVIVNFTGPDVYGSKSFNLNQTKGENNALVAFIGFTTGGFEDNVRLTKGALIVEKLDTETLDFKVTFEGAAQSIAMKDGKRAIEEIPEVSGEIDIQFDNKEDMRKNK